MTDDFNHNFQMWCFLAVLIFVGIGLFFNAAKSCDVNIKYDLIPTTNNTSPIAIAELKLSCYKLCIEQIKGNTALQTTCFDKCEKIGDNIVRSS